MQLPMSISDEELKEIARRWVAALAQQRYSEAIAMICPVVLRGSGSLDHRKEKAWTPQLLEAVVNNYGLPDALDGETHKLVVAPLGAELREAFEKSLQIDRGPFEEFGQRYLGTIHLDLPLIYPTRISLSDLTARFYLKPIGADAIVMVLLDIHVM